MSKSDNYLTNEGILTTVCVALMALLVLSVVYFCTDREDSTPKPAISEVERALEPLFDPFGTRIAFFDSASFETEEGLVHGRVVGRQGKDRVELQVIYSEYIKFPDGKLGMRGETTEYVVLLPQHLYVANQNPSKNTRITPVDTEDVE